MTDQQTIAQFIEKHGITLTVTEGPQGRVSKPRTADPEDKPWPHIFYRVKLSRQGGGTMRTPFKLGIGHVKPEKQYRGSVNVERLTGDEEHLLYAWQRKPYAQFIDQELQASLAAKLAKAQRVAPAADDVLDSMTLSLRAFMDRMNFRDWCAELGDDPDSIKALRLFHRVIKEGRRVHRWLGNDLAAELLDCEPL